MLVHVDAAQAAGRVPIAFADLGADLLSVSAPQVRWPARRRARCWCAVGCACDRCSSAATRSGPAAPASRTVAALVGFGAAAAALAGDGSTREAADQTALDRARPRRARAALDGVRRLRRPDPADRLPHLVCLGIDGVEPQAVLLGLDRAGVAAHSGSACASESLEPSPVLEAMGVDAHRSLRLSTGWSTVGDDVDAALAALPGILADLRALAGGQSHPR